MGRAWLAALLLAVAASQGAAQPQGVIQVSNGRFVDDTCSEFLFSGWNGWGLLQKSVSDPSYITAKFQQAQASSLNLLRFFLMGGDGEGGAMLLSAPGQLNERMARSLDFILSEAGKYGVKVTLAFLNTWKPGGVPQFEKWCGTSGTIIRPRPDIDLRPGTGLNATERLVTPYAWLTSPTCRQQVKDFMSAVVNRRNTLTGLLYKEDPAIFSWNLINEPRCKYCGPEPVDAWLAEMALHLKSVDPLHLVTTGEEGFFVEGDPMEAYNPTDGNLWSQRGGQDIRANHAHPDIDYAVLHLWPDNWRKSDPFDVAWGQRWIDAHVQVASELGKPLILEEFGKKASDGDITAVRDPWFDMVHSAVGQSLQSGGPLRGSLFWQWDGEDGPRPDDMSLIRSTDSTFAHIEAFSRDLAASPRALVPGCNPRTTSAGSADTSMGPSTAPALGLGVGSGGSSSTGKSSSGGPTVQQLEGPSGGRKLLGRG